MDFRGCGVREELLMRYSNEGSGVGGVRVVAWACAVVPLYLGRRELYPFASVSAMLTLLWSVKV